MKYKSVLTLLCAYAIVGITYGSNNAFFVEDIIHSDSTSVDSTNKNEIIADTLLSIADTVPNTDTSVTFNDSIVQKTSIPFSPDTFDATIKYSAEDSIIYDVDGKKVLLFGNAVVDYTNIKLEADYIEYHWTKNMLIAEVRRDSLGRPIQYAKFHEGENEYLVEKMTYNFKTKKGKVYEAMTREGEGYVHSEAIKKTNEDEWYGYKGKYTTCNLENPHFYLQAKKMKVVPDKVIATGPANLVIADVPTPLYMPFGLFPIKQGRRSGVLMPEWGEEANRGFFIRNGGYYFAISDYFDLAVQGDVYTRGSWALRTATNYKKRYKFDGRVNLEYQRNRLGEPESPSFSIINDFSVAWRHTQTARQTLGSRFSSDVRFQSSTFDKNLSQDRDRVLNNSIASYISYSKSWSGTPFSISVNLRHDQSVTTRKVNLSLPVLSFAVSRFQPFKSKKVSTKRKWYENIGMSYRLDAQNIISGADSTFFDKKTFQNAKYGIKHTIPISSSFKVFKHFTLTPRINYTDRWYFKTIRKSWNPDTTYVVNGDSTIDTIPPMIVRDTVTGFKSARDFSFGLSLSTKVYGQLNFKSKKVKALRHVLTPSLSFTYVPDFAKDIWGYYKQVQTDEEGNMATYSIFEGGVYGSPPQGQVGNVSLSFDNVLEMKVFSKKDTVKNERKIKLLESLRVSSSYNIFADSLNVGAININGRTTLYKNISLRFSTVLDPYAVNEDNRRVNKFVWSENRRFTRLTRADVAVTASFASKKNSSATTSSGTQAERDFVRQQRDLYYDFTIPWSFSLSYNLGLSRGIPGNVDTFLVSRNSFDFNINMNITPKWKFDINTGYDLVRRDFVYTNLAVVRDLHCWVLRFDYVPYPRELQSYAIQINVKSHVLQDLKLTRKKNRLDSGGPGLGGELF